MSNQITTILFDLDGTLMDTAPDMLHAINLCRRDKQTPPLADDFFHHHVGAGTAAILKHSFAINPSDPNYEQLKEVFYDRYEQHLGEKARLYDHMDRLLENLQSLQIPWGIVTNKPTRFTLPLLEHFDLMQHCQWVVCGDTLPQRKPDPEPLLHACQLAECSPTQAVYIGDNRSDIIAAKAAGTHSIAVTYGYSADHKNAHYWQADAVAHSVPQLWDLLKDKLHRKIHS